MVLARREVSEQEGEVMNMRWGVPEPSGDVTVGRHLTVVEVAEPSAGDGVSPGVFYSRNPSRAPVVDAVVERNWRAECAAKQFEQYIGELSDELNAIKAAVPETVALVAEVERLGAENRQLAFEADSVRDALRLAIGLDAGREFNPARVREVGNALHAAQEAVRRYYPEWGDAADVPGAVAQLVAGIAAGVERNRKQEAAIESLRREVRRRETWRRGESQD